MFGIKKKIIDSAIDGFRDALLKKLEELKKAIGDSDKDGVNDVDQLIAMVHKYSDNAKEYTSGVDLAKLADGIQKIAEGVQEITDAFDKEKLMKIKNEIARDLKLIGFLITEGAKRLKG